MQSFWYPIVFVGTKGLEKGLDGRTSKSESLEPKSESKSKSNKNGLKSGLESKSGLEYYKSGLCVGKFDAKYLGN